MRPKKAYIVIFAVMLLSMAAVSYWLWHRRIAIVTAIPKTCSPCAQTVIFSYDDFGPQVTSYELIGYAWNQWKSEGHELPDDVDVKVVVYRGIELEELRKQFPVAKGKSDYRYLEYRRAFEFLQEQIKAVESYKKEEQEAADSEASAVKMWEKLEQTLKKTHRVIIENLGV
jgi:hypothetical protein